MLIENFDQKQLVLELEPSNRARYNQHLKADPR